jgi:hypothetical protein
MAVEGHIYPRDHNPKRTAHIRERAEVGRTHPTRPVGATAVGRGILHGAAAARRTNVRGDTDFQDEGWLEGQKANRQGISARPAAEATGPPQSIAAILPTSFHPELLGCFIMKTHFHYHFKQGRVVRMIVRSRRCAPGFR